jgi:ribosome biogenesis GTPase
MLDNIYLPRLQAIGLAPPVIQNLLKLQAGDLGQPMRIVEVQRDSVQLHDGASQRRARSLPTLLATLAADDDALAVGDWVIARANAHGEWWVHARVPPATQLARRLHDGRDKVTRTVIVSNVDTALLVMGLDGDFNLRRLERYLALARLAGVPAVVVLTKADLCSAATERLREVRSVLSADIGAVALNALGDEPRAKLAPWLARGQTLVLLGSSGAGKSTLINALAGTALQATGATREGDGRGRHTTTSRSLHLLPEGACIIDTPGLRTLRLDGDEAQVQSVFGDIAELALQCRFRDCTHEGEPGCAVRGQVDPERLRNFHKLRREARRDQMTALERKEQVQVWKVRSRAARERARAKR